MGIEWKKTVPVFVLVLLAVVAGVVVAVATRESRPDVAGIYTGQNGGEIHLAKDGTFTRITIPLFARALSVKGSSHYWVSGNTITIGGTKSGPQGPPTFKVEGNNRLVGDGTVWVKQSVEPNRPSSLVGTYVSSDGETLALYKNGAIYDSQLDSQRQPSGGYYGTWVAGKNIVTVTYPDLAMKNALKTAYTINGKNLAGGGKEFVKKSDKAMTPPIPNYVMKPGSTAFRNPFSDIKGIPQL